MTDSRPLDRGPSVSDPTELAPFSLESLPWEPRREPTWSFTKAFAALVVGVGLASVGAVMIFDRVGLPTPEGIPQLEPRATPAAAPVDEPALAAAPPIEDASPSPAPTGPPLIVATEVPRAVAAPRAPARGPRGPQGLAQRRGAAGRDAGGAWPASAALSQADAAAAHPDETESIELPYEAAPPVAPSVGASSSTAPSAAPRFEPESL